TVLLTVGGASGAAPPNIVFLISDDHSSFSLGCYGGSNRTPNLDKLAASGIRFTNAFVASPQCSPSRSAMLTGLSPHRTNTSRLHTPLRAEHRSIIEHLKAAGYHAGGFKKHHLGQEVRDRFDFYQNSENWPAFFDGRPKDKPFFLWVGFTDPHRDYEPGAATPPHDPAEVKVPAFLPDTPQVRADLALYHDEITRMDGHCGEILALLEKHGVADNTLVFFFGDNGMPFPGAKGTLYDPGVRVPLIACWPAGKLAAGRVVDSLVSLIDLTPTCLDVAGLKPLAEADGVTFKPLLTGDAKSTRQSIISERNWHDNFDPSRCIRTERFKLIYYCRPEMPYTPITDLARSPTWQSILALERDGKLAADMRRRFFQSPRATFELYDLDADPNETNNLAEDPAHRGTREDLEGRLNKWMEETNDFLPPPQRAARAQRLMNKSRPATTRTP
ncbi:MAG: N-sulfoglucosamine sulfohydrolase, partial [Phycisphaerales bacterium]|nr:N-sulfoglucosamine sulfohydrolase [Phycisphaerales bacterium]